MEIGPVALFSHGVFSAIGFLIGVLWFVKVAQKKHLHLEFIADHFFSLIFWAVLGARLGYVFVFYPRYQDNLLSVFSLWDGGYFLWTGIVFFLLALLYHCSKQKEKIGQWLDVIIPAGIIAFVLETFGAFLGGNHFGKPTEMAWGVVFENAEVPFTIPIHPVQLYLLGSLLILLVIIQILHRRKVRESLVGLVSLALFSLFSFLTEYFRGDEMILYFNHRFTQILELMVFIFSVILILVYKKRARIH
ncbi:MAG: prolipoprotein diacylglyceryl transferase [bacterium]|nr:prolipoprotein diacylglyceryl transferase [bacterium]